MLYDVMVYDGYDVICYMIYEMKNVVGLQVKKILDRQLMCIYEISMRATFKH